MKIVFWNIKKGSLSKELSLLAQEVQPDILFLAEVGMTPQAILMALNEMDNLYYFHRDDICTKILMFSKFLNANIKPVTSDNRYMVKSINIPTYPKFNLMALHYQSKQNWDANNQAAHASEWRQIITEFEQKTRSTNSILIGDFNMNPFDAGMVQTTGLHSVMTKSVAEKGNRKVDNKIYPFFYNPMWSFFGDYGKGDVNGTFYLTKSQPINYFWNILDQVLVRPSILPYFDEDKLDILTTFGDTLNLLKPSGFLDKNISDHLPISITIKQYSDE